MRTNTGRLAAVTLMTALALAGCGGSDSDSKPDADKPKASAPTGKTIEGDGYTYVVPKGWDVPAKKIPGTEATDTFVADLKDTDGFSDNVNVIKQDTAPPKPIPEIKDDLGDQLKQAGGQNVEVKEVGKIDGEDSVHVSSTQASNLTEQYFVVHDGATYFITFSHSEDVPEADRSKLAASVLSSWKWTA